MEVDQGVIVEDFGMVRGDESHAPHIRGEGIHLINSPCGLETIIPAPKVQNLEFIRVYPGVFRILYVHSPHPVTFALQIGRQMMPDKPSRSGYERPHLLGHKRHLLNEW